MNFRSEGKDLVAALAVASPVVAAGVNVEVDSSNKTDTPEVCTITISPVLLSERKVQLLALSSGCSKLDWSLPLAVCFNAPAANSAAAPSNVQIFQTTATGSSVDVAYADPLRARLDATVFGASVWNKAKPQTATPIIATPIIAVPNSAAAVAASAAVVPVATSGGSMDNKHANTTSGGTTTATAPVAAPTAVPAAAADQKSVALSAQQKQKAEDETFLSTLEPTTRSTVLQIVEMIPTVSVRLAAFALSQNKKSGGLVLSIDDALERLMTPAARVSTMEAMTAELKKPQPVIKPRPKERAVVEHLLSIFPDIPVAAIKLALRKDDDDVEKAAARLTSDKKVAKLISEAEAEEFEAATNSDRKRKTDSASAAAAPETGEGDHRKGDTVDALYRVSEWLKDCTISAVNPNGSCTPQHSTSKPRFCFSLVPCDADVLKYSNGTELINCPALWIRKPLPVPAVIAALKKLAAAQNVCSRVVLALLNAE